MKTEDFYEEMGGNAQYCEWDLGDAHHSKKDMVEFADDFLEYKIDELILEMESLRNRVTENYSIKEGVGVEIALTLLKKRTWETKMKS